MSSLTVLSRNAINANIDAIHAAIAEAGATGSAEAAFSVSAVSFWLATKGGLKFAVLADRIKVATADLSAPTGTAYTSDTAVEYHARTGQVLSLPVDLESPLKLAPRALQAKIKTAQRALGAPAVRTLINGAKTQADAMARIASAVTVKAEADSVATAEAAEAVAQAVEAVASEPVGAMTLVEALRVAVRLIGEGAEIDADVTALLGTLLESVTVTA